MEAAADPRVRTAPEDFEEVQAMLGARNPKYAGASRAKQIHQPTAPRRTRSRINPPPI